MDHEANLTLRKYGKSFYWARFFLPHRISVPATNLYDFCRLLDDIADGGVPGGIERLIDIESQITGKVAITESKVNRFLELVDTYKIDLEIIHQLLLGLMGDMSHDKNLILSKSDLLRYCFRVAGTVGLMMAPILGARDQSSYPFAIDLGIAMQLTNIGRDILEDAQLGRRYIPADWCDGIAPAEIVRISKDPNEIVLRKMLIQSVTKLLLLAGEYYKSGLAGLSYLPLQSHISMGVAAFIYREIGEKLKRKRYEWWQGRQIVDGFGKINASLSFIPQLKNRKILPIKHDYHLHKGLEGFPGVHLK